MSVRASAASFARYLCMPNGDRAVLLLTFGLTVLVDLTVAIGVGVTLASLMFMAKMSETVEIGSETDRSIGDDEFPEDLHQRDEVPDGVEVFRINGPFFFGVVGGLLDTFRAMGQQPKVIILRMRLVPMIDATGATALEAFVDRAKRIGTRVILSGVQVQPKAMLERVNLGSDTGHVIYAENFASALIAAQAAVDSAR